MSAVAAPSLPSREPISTCTRLRADRAWNLAAMEDEPRGQRARENEERFAHANAEIKTVADRVGVDGKVPFLCECSDLGCTGIIKILLDDYRAAKSPGGAFVLLPGHDDANVERVVSEGEGFVIVKKYE